MAIVARSPSSLRSRGRDEDRRQLPGLAALPPTQPRRLFYPHRSRRRWAWLWSRSRRRACGCCGATTSWRETLLVSWIVVPVVFFELWPVKGFQYLLPIAPAVALLGARAVVRLPGAPPSRAARERGRPRWPRHRFVVASGRRPDRGVPGVPSWARIEPVERRPPSSRDRAACPAAARPGLDRAARPPWGARCSRSAPRWPTSSQYYGHRKVYGLSVSPNPLHRNPVYEPREQPRPADPDQRAAVRRLGRLLGQAGHRSSRDRLLRYAERYHGRVVHQETVSAKTAGRPHRPQADHHRLRGAAMSPRHARTRAAPRRRLGAALVVCPRPRQQRRSRRTRSPGRRTPIKHFVVLMQENHSFDNYFGTYPGADGIPAGTLHASHSSRPSPDACIKPFRLGNQADRRPRPQHRASPAGSSTAARWTASSSASRLQDADRVNPAAWATTTTATSPTTGTSPTTTSSSIASSPRARPAASPTTCSGSPGRPASPAARATRSSPTTACDDPDDLRPPRGGRDLLEVLRRRTTTRAITFRSASSSVTAGRRSSGSRLLDYARFVDDPELIRHIVDLDQYYTDVAARHAARRLLHRPVGLQRAPARKHPGRPGASSGRSSTPLMRSSCWSSSAFMWTYDDWGGWYDHVRPPRVDSTATASGRPRCW